MNEYRFAASRACFVKQRAESRGVRYADRRALLKGNVLGEGMHRGLFAQDLLRVGSRGGHYYVHAIANFHAIHIRADPLHHSSSVPPGSERQSRLARVIS